MSLPRDADVLGASGVPYYSQWESPELVPQFLAGSLSAADDPNWAASGARTPAEYAFWASRVCGLACLRMVLDSRGLPVPPVIRLVEQALTWNAYVRDGDRVEGLIYKPFADWVGHDYGISAAVVPDLTLDQVRASASPGCASDRLGAQLDPLAGPNAAANWRSPGPGNRRGGRHAAAAQPLGPAGREPARRSDPGGRFRPVLRRTRADRRRVAVSWAGDPGPRS